MDLQPIQNKIHEIRGYKVMLDFDLAELYGTNTAQLKRQVRRNIERFEGEDFMFEITIEELSRCQFGILNKGRGGNIKYLPFAFTELGVSMLSSVLNSKTAIEKNRNIMRAFVAMRHLVLSQPENNMNERIAVLENRFNEMKTFFEDVLTDQNDINQDTRMQLELINEALAELQVNYRESNKIRRRIGFNTQQNEL